MKLSRISLLMMVILMSVLVGSQAFAGSRLQKGGGLKAPLKGGRTASQTCPYYVTCYNGLATNLCCYGSVDMCLAFCEGVCDGPCIYIGD
jgi:hypothetical protein